MNIFYGSAVAGLPATDVRTGETTCRSERFADPMPRPAPCALVRMGAGVHPTDRGPDGNRMSVGGARHLQAMSPR